MKTRSILAAILLLLVTGASYAQGDWADKFSDRKDVTRVTIGQTMLSMVPSMIGQANMGGVNLKDIASKLENIDIFTSEAAEAVQWMRTEMTAFFKDNKAYEVLMKVKDGDDDVIFYVQKEGKTILSLVMLVDEVKEYVIIRLSGKFTAEDIQNVIGNKKE